MASSITKEECMSKTDKNSIVQSVQSSVVSFGGAAKENFGGFAKAANARIRRPPKLAIGIAVGVVLTAGVTTVAMRGMTEWRGLDQVESKDGTEPTLVA